MSIQRVLWLVEREDAGVEAGPETLPPGLGITRVADPADAAAAIRAGKAECLLVSHSSSEHDRKTVLGLFLGIDSQIPVLFWHRDLCAREAIALIREGAFTCHGPRDSWPAVLESIKQACEEKQRRDLARRG